MYKIYIAFCTCLLLYAGIVQAQNDSTINKLSSALEVDGKTIARLQKQYTALEPKLDKQSAKLLFNMQRSEDKLQRKLSGVDCLKAKTIFTDDVKQHYTDLQSGLSKETDSLTVIHFPKT